MKHFRLSCRGRVAATLMLSLVCTVHARAEGMVPAAGSGVTVQTAPGGVDVVRIVAPNAAGLSHNRFSDYNVGKPGAVLNNAIEAGQSRLAGALQANAALGGRAAAVILNEVVARNPSLLLGQQEIFGKAADFVLANPNGITCNGCGFINTPRASLLVGRPLIEEGRLKGLSAAGAPGMLSVGENGLVAGDVLDMIAPRLDTRGKVVATSGILAVSGSGTVDYAKSKTASAAGGPLAQIDSAYLGGMQAGRISIVSTDEGAGVNLSGLFEAGQRVSVETRGKVALEAATLKGDRVVMDAGDIDVRARVTTTPTENRHHDESWFIWKTGETSTVEQQVSTRVERSRLEGGRIKLAARNAIELSAAEVVADAVSLKAGGAIRLDGVESIESKSMDSNSWKNSWKHRRYTNDSRITQQGSLIESTGNITLDAGGQIDVKGSRLAAGDTLRIMADGDVRVAALAGRVTSVDNGSRYLEGPGLESGDWNKINSQESLQESALQAGHDLKLSSSGGALDVRGSRVQAGGDILLLGGRGVDIAAQSASRVNVLVDNTKSWGGIGGSDRKNDRGQATVSAPSDIAAQGRLTVRSEGDIRIAGSQVKGGTGASAETRQGEVHIEYVTDSSVSLVDERRGGAFDIQTGRRLGQAGLDEVKEARVASDTNLQLRSGGDLSVTGSQVEARGELTVNAGGDVRLDAAATHEVSSRYDARLGGLASAEENAQLPGSYRAEAGIEQVTQRSKSASDRHSGGELSGGTVHVEAGGQIGIVGGHIEAHAGDVSLRGGSVRVDAVDNVELSRTDTARSGLGVFASGSKGDVKGGVWQRNAHTQDSVATVTPQGGRVTATGDISVDAGAGALQTRGAGFDAGGTLSIDAGRVDNRAAMGSSRHSHQDVSINTEVGAGIELGSLLQPVEDLAGKLKNGDFSGAVADAGKIKDGVKAGAERVRAGDWSGAAKLAQNAGMTGAVVEVSHAGEIRTDAKTEQSAQGSRFSGAEVEIRSAGALNDQASHYEARTGQVDMQADSQSFESAQTETRSGSSRLDWRLGVKAATMTGDDLALNVSLGGGYASQSSRTEAVQSGSIRGGGGVKLEVTGDAVLQSTQVAGGDGGVAMHAGGDLRLQAAGTASQVDSSRTGGQLGVDLALQPNGQNAANMGGSGKLGWDVAREEVSGQGWQGSQISTSGRVSLQAGGDVSLQASRVGATEGSTRTGSVAITAGGAVELAAAVSSREQTSWGTSGDLTVKARTGATPGGGANVKVDVQPSARQEHAGAAIDGTQVSLSSGGDMRLAGAQVTGERVSAEVGGNLSVVSVRDSARSDSFSLDAGVTVPDVGKVTGQDENLHLRGHYGRERLEAAIQQSGLAGSDQLNVRVGGNTVLEGGMLKSGASAATPAGGGSTTAMSVPGSYASDRYGINVKGSPVDIAKSGVDAVLSGQLPFGVSRETQHESRPMPATSVRS